MRLGRVAAYGCFRPVLADEGETVFRRGMEIHIGTGQVAAFFLFRPDPGVGNHLKAVLIQPGVLVKQVLIILPLLPEGENPCKGAGQDIRAFPAHVINVKEIVIQAGHQLGFGILEIETGQVMLAAVGHKRLRIGKKIRLGQGVCGQVGTDGYQQGGAVIGHQLAVLVQHGDRVVQKRIVVPDEFILIHLPAQLKFESALVALMAQEAAALVVFMRVQKLRIPCQGSRGILLRPQGFEDASGRGGEHAPDGQKALQVQSVQAGTFEDILEAAADPGQERQHPVLRLDAFLGGVEVVGLDHQDDVFGRIGLEQFLCHDGFPGKGGAVDGAVEAVEPQFPCDDGGIEMVYRDGRADKGDVDIRPGLHLLDGNAREQVGCDQVHVCKQGEEGKYEAETEKAHKAFQIMSAHSFLHSLSRMAGVNS